jgi:hypothetical protein
MPQFLNSLGPRRFGEHKWHDKLKKIATTDLRGGDILIAKEWSNRALDVAVIRLGQAIFSHHAEASSQSEHVILNCEDGQASTIESLSQGLLISDRINMRDHVVYSCRDEDLRWEAVYVAETLAGKRKIDASNDYQGKYRKYYDDGKSEVKYRSNMGTAATLFRRKHQGKGALARIQKLYDIVYNGGSIEGVRMICSEFVASCYEVAAMRLNERSDKEPIYPFGQGVDPRAMTAKAFEAVLHRSYSQFSFAGTYIGAAPMTEAQLEADKWFNLYKVAKERTNNPQMTPEQAYQWFQTDKSGQNLTLDGLPSLAQFKQYLDVYRKFHPMG